MVIHDPARVRWKWTLTSTYSIVSTFIINCSRDQWCWWQQDVEDREDKVAGLQSGDLLCIKSAQHDPFIAMLLCVSRASLPTWLRKKECDVVGNPRVVSFLAVTSNSTLPSSLS